MLRDYSSSTRNSTETVLLRPRNVSVNIPVQDVATATVTLHSRNTQCSNGTEICSILGSLHARKEATIFSNLVQITLGMGAICTRGRKLLCLVTSCANHTRTLGVVLHCAVCSCAHAHNIFTRA